MFKVPKNKSSKWPGETLWTQLVKNSKKATWLDQVAININYFPPPLNYRNKNKK